MITLGKAGNNNIAHAIYNGKCTKDYFALIFKINIYKHSLFYLENPFNVLQPFISYTDSIALYNKTRKVANDLTVSYVTVGDGCYV